MTILGFVDFFHDRPVYRDTWKKLKYFFYIYPDGSDLTETTTMTTTMTTTTMNVAATTAVQTKKTTQPPRRKWSDEDDDEAQSYYCREDNDTVRLTVGEQRRIQGYHANAQRNWRNADEEDNDQRVVAAAQAIVRSIRRDFEAQTQTQTQTAAPEPKPCVSSVFWTTPRLIACGDEPVFEPEYPEHDEHEESTHVHVPYMNLTKEQRAEKSNQFKFGLCSDCDAGLGDESDFVCEPSRPTGAFVMRCEACHDYYQQVWLKRAGCECAGCN